MNFLSESVVVSTIKKDGGYIGARIGLFGELAKVKIQIDIGYGDAVTPGSIDANYPVLMCCLLIWANQRLK